MVQPKKKAGNYGWVGDYQWAYNNYLRSFQEKKTILQFFNLFFLLLLFMKSSFILEKTKESYL